MKKAFKITLLLVAFAFAINVLEGCKTKTKSGVNNYLKAKTRISEKQLRADKKAIARNNKNYKKKMGQSRKHLFGRKTAPTK